MADINGKTRQILLDWLILAGGQLKHSIRTYYLCVHFVDKYMSLTPDLSRQHLQAVGLCAMSLASDFVDHVPTTIDEYYEVCGETYTVEFLVQLKELIWKK